MSCAPHPTGGARVGPGELPAGWTANGTASALAPAVRAGGAAPRDPPSSPPPLFFYLRGCPAPVSGPVRSPRRTPGLARPGSQPLGAARPWACPLGCRAGPRPSPQLIPSD